MSSPLIFAGLLLLLRASFSCCSSSALALPPSASNTSCPSSCSSIHNVSFPFGTTNDSCSLPEFRLNCSQSRPLWLSPNLSSPLFQVLAITSNQISQGTIVIQNTSNVSSCSALNNPKASSFPLSCPKPAFGLDFRPAQNIILLINCDSKSIHGLQANQPVGDGFFFSTRHCVDFYSACNTSFRIQKNVTPCIEMINEVANLSSVKKTYGCESITSLYRIPTNRSSELAIQLSWVITQSYYNCDSCKKSNGTCHRNSVNDSFFCSCPKGQNYTTVCPASTDGSCKPAMLCKTSVLFSLGGSAILVAILIVGAFFGIYCCYKSKAANQVKNLQLDSNTDLKLFLANQCGPVKQKTFTYDELLYATNSFSVNKMLGDGGFGTVYEGTLYNGQKVAVKRLYAENARKLEQFFNEIRILSALIDHPNLVKLYGFCCEKQDDLLLVYEFVSNGTLAYNLHGDAGKGLLWETRLSIALETAQAIAYLHSRVPPILHRDVKSTNILLDENFHVKVADFGLSRFVPVTATHVSTAPQGTPGYVDPEYHHCYQLNDKSDVYSFGVVLVELVSGKTPVDLSRDRMEINLSSLAVAKIQTGALDELIDPYLEVCRYSAVKEMVERVAELAFQCLALSKDDRPSMKEVVEVLMDIEKFRNGDAGRKKKQKTLVSRDSLDVDETSKLMEPCRTPTSPTSVQDKWLSSANNSVVSSAANGGKQPQTVMTSLNST